MLRLLLFAAIAFGVFSGTYSSSEKTNNSFEKLKAQQVQSQMPATMLLPMDRFKSPEQKSEVKNAELAK